MPTDTLFAIFRQVSKNLCRFELWQSRESLPCHCCFRVLSLSIVPFALSYLLAHNSDWGVLEHSRIFTPWTLIILVSLGGRHSQRLGPSPSLGSLGSSHQWRHKSRCHSGIPFGPMVLRYDNVGDKPSPICKDFYDVVCATCIESCLSDIWRERPPRFGDTLSSRASMSRSFSTPSLYEKVMWCRVVTCERLAAWQILGDEIHCIGLGEPSEDEVWVVAPWCLGGCGGVSSLRLCRNIAIEG